MQPPDHLPDFTDPPLDEVAFGVQFEPVPGYSSVHSMKVWDLFKPEFPGVEEHHLLDTQFEIFGGANVQAGPRIHIKGAPIGSRLWFLSEDKNRLLQFQADRFIANWRKRPTQQPYPRFEKISDAFEKNLNKLAVHLTSKFECQIEINQAEVTYVNIIPVENFSQAGDWFELWNDGGIDIEALNYSFNEVIRGSDGKPLARLNHEIKSVFTADSSHKAFRLSLTYKGKPADNNIASAMEFLANGREAIVTRFGEITTKKAHQIWRKVG